MTQTIKIKCQGSRTLPVSELRPFQGNLKTLTEANYIKLKGLMLSQGFSFPIFVWNDKENDQTYIIDGHQRVRALEKLVSEGYDIPPIPIADVQAESFAEAKKKLLAAASQFGDVDGQGLYEFLNENEFDVGFLEENFKLPDLDFDKFKSEFLDDEDDFNFKDTSEGGDGSESCSLVVDFPDGVSMEKLLMELTNRGFKARVKR